MFEELGAFDQAFPPTPENGPQGNPPRLLRRCKTLMQKITFWGSNLVLTPLIGLTYVTVVAEGLRQVMNVFATKIHKTPLPGAGVLRDWDGWSDLDLAIVMSILIFVVVTFVWIRAFSVLIGVGELAEQRLRNPILFFLLAAIGLIIISTDIGLFYLGLEAKSSSGWSDTPSYVATVASIAYMASLALFGWWHADFHTSGTV